MNNRLNIVKEANYINTGELVENPSSLLSCVSDDTPVSSNTPMERRIMRIDVNTEFVCNNAQLPDFKERAKEYLSHYIYGGVIFELRDIMAYLHNNQNEEAFIKISKLIDSLKDTSID